MQTTLQNTRLATLQAKLAPENFDAFLVSHFANRRYLSGYSASDYPPNETAGFLLITPNAAFLLTNFLYADAARTEVAPAGFEVITPATGDTFTQALAKLLQKLNLKRIGFESIAFVYDFYAETTKHLENSAELIGTKGFVESLRLIKEPQELALMRKAISISDRAFDEARPLMQAGVSEKYIAWQIERRIREFGGEALAFETIVASGTNGSTPHAVPSERLLQVGDPVIVDMGARYEGYNSDMTRTICVGNPTARFKEIYNIVLEAQTKACEKVRPGLNCGDADKIARDIIDQHGYGETFGHSLGHGIGLAVHEPPRITKNSDQVLEANMVHSVEPGIYLAGWGGVRIEDLVLVTPDGYENLTKAQKDNFYR